MSREHPSESGRDAGLAAAGEPNQHRGPGHAYEAALAGWSWSAAAGAAIGTADELALRKAAGRACGPLGMGPGGCASTRAGERVRAARS